MATTKRLTETQAYANYFGIDQAQAAREITRLSEVERLEMSEAIAQELSVLLVGASDFPDADATDPEVVEVKQAQDDCQTSALGAEVVEVADQAPPGEKRHGI